MIGVAVGSSIGECSGLQDLKIGTCARADRRTGFAPQEGGSYGAAGKRCAHTQIRGELDDLEFRAVWREGPSLATFVPERDHGATPGEQGAYRGPETVRRAGSDGDGPTGSDGCRHADGLGSGAELRRSGQLGLETRHVPRLGAELHAHQMHRLGHVAVLVRVASILQLRQRRPGARPLPARPCPAARDCRSPRRSRPAPAPQSTSRTRSRNPPRSGRSRCGCATHTGCSRRRRGTVPPDRRNRWPAAAGPNGCCSLPAGTRPRSGSPAGTR